MIVFTHIPKTGGQTFIDLLEQLFKGWVGHDYTNVFTPWLVGKHKDLIMPSKPLCIVGHFRTDKYDSPDALHVTFVRDPVEQVISSYHQTMRNLRDNSDWSPNCDKLTPNLSLEEFVEIKDFWNLQSYHLGSKSFEDFFFIGVTDEYDKSINLFLQLFNIKKKVFVNVLNKNPKKDFNTKYNVSVELINRIREVNSKDVKLYNKAKQQLYRLNENLEPLIIDEKCYSVIFGVNDLQHIIDGWNELESWSEGFIRWTNGNAKAQIQKPIDKDFLSLELFTGPKEVDSQSITISIFDLNDNLLKEQEFKTKSNDWIKIRMDLKEIKEKVLLIKIKSKSWNPSKITNSDDKRTLGVAIKLINFL